MGVIYVLEGLAWTLDLFCDTLQLGKPFNFIIDCINNIPLLIIQTFIEN